MTNEEKILIAIGEIDDELINEASAPYKAKFNSLTRGLTIAASVTIVSAVILASSGLFMPKSFDKNDMGGAAPPFENSGADGGDFVGTVESEHGFISDIVKTGDHTLKFDLRIFLDCSESFDVLLIGKSSDGSKKAICSSGDAPEGYDLILSPTITVNGNEADTLPNKAGVYTVVIDFSAISGTDYTFEEYFEILGFGRIKR